MTKILGESIATAQQMSEYLLSKNKNPKFSRNINTLEFCQLFIDICAKEGVRGDVAFAQSCKETGNFSFKGDVKYTQNNFAGLGTTGNGICGCIFKDIETGILAQAQHLKTYATKNTLNQPCVDPRRTTWFVNAKGGISPNVETLSGTWAVPGYSTQKYSSLKEANLAKDSYGYQIVDILNNILKINVKEEEKKLIKVAIDAGHGSTTAGKRTVDGYKEHYINVMSAYYCEQYLLQHGIQTFRVAWDDLTSTDDSDVALSTRQAQIKAAGCDYSISFHANAHGDGKTWTTGQGVSTHIHSVASYRGDSLKLGKAVQTRLVQGTAQKNRGVVYQDLAMCNCIKLGVKAAVLVEIGFMTNYNEAMLMKTTAFCKEQGEDAARGILDYLGIKSTTNITTTSSKDSVILADTYTVVKGDVLSKIGSKLGIKWKTIAELNGIKFPYTLSVGQVLKLPTTNKTTTNNVTTNMPVSGNYSLIFDANFYSNKYSDLKNAFGTNETKLLDHFKTYGMKEGRQAISTFNVQVYKNKNEDLRKAFGTAGYEKYFEHYLTYGYKENRKCV